MSTTRQKIRRLINHKHDRDYVIPGFLTDDERLEVEGIYSEIHNLVRSFNKMCTMQIVRIEFDLEGLQDANRVAKCGIVKRVDRSDITDC